MAGEYYPNKNNNSKHERRGSVVIISQEATACSGKPVIFNPDFFVERLRHDRPQAFADIVLSNITRLIDLPGDEQRTEGIAQIYQLIEYLSKNLHVEGLFRVPGHSLRQAALREMLNSGAEIDLQTGDFHPNDAATLLKTFLGELPEPLLTHRHYHAHLKISERTLFDEQGNKTDVPDKERQIEAFQLLFMLLPPANRSLLKLLLDLLYHTARKQHTNKMSAINLATMFAPHIIWPKNVTASDLQGNIKKLNNGIAFLIKHSQKLFKAPAYVKEYARVYFTGSKTLQSKDDLSLRTGRVSGSMEEEGGTPVSHRHTEDALRELQQQISSMPASAKKKRLIRQ
ncbi:hypothetical protein CRUP_035571, partial [Coryphaenoides rupestris]